MNNEICVQGMIELRNALSDVVDEFGTDDGGFQVRISSLYMGDFLGP